MATTTIGKAPTEDWRYDPATMTACVRCGVGYSVKKSSSGLRLSYCGRLCEVADLGRSIEALEMSMLTRKANNRA